MKRLFAAAALLASINHVTAGEISLYTHNDFAGPQVTLRGPASNFATLGFNDRASSVVVHSGAWQACEHKDFGGQCIVLERGEYRELGRFNDKMSSLRELERGRDGRGGRRDDDGRSWRDRRDDDPRDRRGAPVELFAGRDFGGERVELGTDVNTLRSHDFNDRARSLVVRHGQWQVCEHDDYRGRCNVYGPGRYPFIEGLNNQASSVRRVR